MRVQLIPPAREHQGGEASIPFLLAIRSGTETLAEAIARKGRNPDAVLAEIAATNAKLDALGIVLDTDPRRVTKTGSAQSIETADQQDEDEPDLRLIAND